MYLSRLQFLISTVFLVNVICWAGDALAIKYDFETVSNSQYYRGWGVTEQKVERIADDERGGHVLRFTGSGWNTAVFDFTPPFTVTQRTVLRFKIKVSHPGGWKILLGDATEGAEYATHFSINEANKWVSVQLTLGDAGYRRFGKPGVKIDGLIGDELGSVQIAYLGKEMLLDDIELVDLSADAFKRLGAKHPEIKEYLKSYKNRTYRQLSRNAVFPFGVILTQRGEDKNAKMFNQKLLDRYDYDLMAIKRGGFNSIADFCTRFDLATHMKLMSYYNLNLLSTQTCNKNIHTKSDEELSHIKNFSHHPNLLGWYGQDEPTDFNLYLKNKRRVETVSDGGAPYTSAMHMPSAVPLGPCMEVVTIDPYSLMEPFDPSASSSILQKHSVHIENTRKLSKGRRVWVIAQAFSRRDNNKRLQRFPRPVEIRFDVLNYLASGASGFMFFIANDTVSYLDHEFRAQEFDQTVFDAWGNGYPVTRELSALAKRLTPIMPSFLDIEPSEKLKISCENEKIIVRQWENELGNLVFCVNSDLGEKVSAKIKFTQPKSTAMYDMETLKPCEKSVVDLNLKPGDCRILLITDKSKFNKAVAEITFRKLLMRWESLDLELKLLEKADFDTAELARKLSDLKPDEKNSLKCVVKELDELTQKIEDLRSGNQAYCNIQKQLARVQAIFGRINAALTATGVIERIDTNPKWDDILNSIRKFGCAYFQFNLAWSNGELGDLDQKLASLEASLVKLEKEIMLKLQNDNIKPYPRW